MKKFKHYLVSLCLMLAAFNNPAESQEYKKNYPEFNWDKIPVCFHFGKRAGLLTSQEAKFVAAHSNFVCLEKAHAIDQFGSTEEGIMQEALQLKKYNPNIKVIFYWNAFLDYPLYQAHNEYENHPGWWLKNKDGNIDLKPNTPIKRYDLSLPEVRNWWTDVAKKGVTSYACDGVFMDAFPQVSSPANQKLWGIEKFDAIQDGLLEMIRQTRQKIGNDKLLVYNGIRSTPQRMIGLCFPDHTDAVMIEHFGHFQSSTKECMKADILELMNVGKKGKIVVFKTWPGFSWLDEDFMKLPDQEKRKIAAENITFPLAAFLIGTQPFSYFIYNWGYHIEHGVLEWYPELDRPLGKPLNDAKINGWEMSREFEHLSVWINLETREAKISPK